MSDLYDFMRQMSATLAAEYARIQRRVKDDPGIAGAQGEENWAELLRSWLPATYHVVTRGRVVNTRGEASPEVDILVLHPAYPRHLLQQKYYLAAGVVAVFECKLTLRRKHLRDAAARCAKVKKIVELEMGTPYSELNRGPIFGVLAHAHEWKPGKLGAAFAIMQSVFDSQFTGVEHPSELIDNICVAGTACFQLTRDVLIGPYTRETHAAQLLKDFEAPNGIATSYVCCWEEGDKPYMGTALGNLISDLMHRLSKKDSSLRPLAAYYSKAGMASGGIAQPVIWHADMLSEPVLKKLKGMKAAADQWSDWHYQA